MKKAFQESREVALLMQSRPREGGDGSHNGRRDEQWSKWSAVSSVSASGGRR